MIILYDDGEMLKFQELIEKTKKKAREIIKKEDRTEREMATLVQAS